MFFKLYNIVMFWTYNAILWEKNLDKSTDPFGRAYARIKHKSHFVKIISSLFDVSKIDNKLIFQVSFY